MILLNDNSIFKKCVNASYDFFLREYLQDQLTFLTQVNFLVLDDLLKPFIIKSALGLYYNLDWSCSNDYGDIIFGNDIWECLGLTGLTKEKNIAMQTNKLRFSLNNVC